jgi:UDP-N-acetylglucosamine--N-acetylmuramyl-(pentapeptide) pyrophosphoryl-undecaprenol N-acetylglucosamine transferase
VLVEAGAAVMLLQRDVTEETLLEELVGLLTDGARRAAMAERARGLAKPGALEKIAGMVVALAGR